MGLLYSTYYGPAETAVLYCSSGPLWGYSMGGDIFCRLKTLSAPDRLLQPPIGLSNVDANWIEEEETTQVGKQEIDCSYVEYEQDA